MLDPSVVHSLPQLQTCHALGEPPTRGEVVLALRRMANAKAMGAAWSSFRRSANVVYDQPTVIVPITLKVRMLQAGVREALLYLSLIHI